ncbi:radical SAM protein [Helicobacter colisuis]|uniref:radical SAM protein n=1 Tax=Helicobacter colisuis TaxID=2949739 RepID=UPI00202A02E8|nr:radical SAM protein [Helicobacter colisuis]MCL9822736.1 radical SAM protein [Helicobacter colisuis]
MKQITIKITNKCNYTCGMCHFFGDSYKEDYFGNRPEFISDMSLEEIKIILKKAKDAGVEKIDFTPNGEFFVYKKWREVLALVQKYGMQSTLTTNGGLLTEQDIKDAVDLGLSQVAVSIDSVHYDTYKIVRKPATKKAFENAINAPILFKQYSSRIKDGGIYVQVQFTEQPENKKEVKDMLDFYRPYKLDQITVNKMFEVFEGGNKHIGVNYAAIPYKIGTCSNYGSYMIQTNGTILGCCGEIYFYPKIKDKVPNIFKQSLEECQKQSDYLYRNDVDFINYCKNCSIYSIHNNSLLEGEFIENGYFARKYAANISYYVIPEYLRGIPKDILLFMYNKGMVGEIKKFVKDRKS